eukprot:CAMPEP_0184693972 /NCGR_PEP_ID=MMETSP0313-20130426/2058_1 /TAXON_ID=2792 /ORGANISM="Porphyridium aerugineum, Strain SAG 1380-2" /LENGTH=548 /DNA_ID=CAMNT_0027152167 /DNA_START=186 /DNA_END=1832 /DNA_ORIENTATION=+
MARIAEHDEADRRIRDLMRIEENSFCADCSSRDPRFVNLTFGTFVCSNCADEHKDAKRRIKNVDTGTFMIEDVERMEKVGNAQANLHFLANWNPRDFPEPKPGDRAALKEFLWLKYDGSWAAKGGQAAARPQQPPPGPPPRGAYDTVGAGAYQSAYPGDYMTYRAPPQPPRYENDSDSDSKSKKKKGKKKKSKSKKGSKSDSDDEIDEDETEFAILDQLKLMFGDASVIQTPMGFRIMTPSGMVFPAMAFRMGYYKMTQQQAIMVLKQREMMKKQQQLQAEQMLKQEALMKEKQAELIKEQAKMVKKGAIPANIAMNQMRMRNMQLQQQQQQQQQQQRQMNMGMGMGMGAMGYGANPMMLANTAYQPMGMNQPGYGMNQGGYGMAQANYGVNPAMAMNPNMQAAMYAQRQQPLALPAPAMYPVASVHSVTSSEAAVSVGGTSTGGGAGAFDMGGMASNLPAGQAGGGNTSNDLFGGFGGGMSPADMLNPMNTPVIGGGQANGALAGGAAQDHSAFDNAYFGDLPPAQADAGAPIAAASAPAADDNPFL